MTLLSSLIHKLRTRKPSVSQSSAISPRAQLAVEPLEDRVVPSAVSTITSNFNGTAIPPGDTVWFSSVFKASGLGSGSVALHVTNQEIDFTVNETDCAVQVPDANITFSPATTQAATTFDGTAWNTTLPTTFSGNAFLSGAALAVPSGLPGGIKNVTWTATFSSDTSGVTVNWQWAAAAYKPGADFSDYNALNVKPVDSPNGSAIKNSDHSGTPETARSFVTGGARGGGGSNYTGSYSGTASVHVPVSDTQNNPLATLSGYVYDISTGAHVGMGKVILTLTGMTTDKQQVTMTTKTETDGSYSFAGLSAGTYTITQTIPDGYFDAEVTPGTINNTTKGQGNLAGLISLIDVNFGDNGMEYDFGDMLPLN